MYKLLPSGWIDQFSIFGVPPITLVNIHKIWQSTLNLLVYALQTVLLYEEKKSCYGINMRLNNKLILSFLVVTDTKIFCRMCKSVKRIHQSSLRQPDCQI